MQRGNTTVSTIIPCYNAAAFLRECLDSVARQTVPPLEVLVVDDGSTDESAAIAESYGPPVRLIRQEHAHHSVARNRGIEEARGDWVALMDADDLWQPEKLERQLAAVEPDVVGVHTNWHNFGARDEIKDSSHVPAEQRYSPEGVLKYGNMIHVSSLIVRRDLPVRFATWCRDCEDIFYYLDLARHGTILLVGEPLTERRCHAESFSTAVGIHARWHAAWEEWLERNEQGLGADRIARLRRKSLEKLVKTTAAFYWKRNWPQFRALREYLRQFAGNPEVDRLLARKVYPRWLFAVKDWLDRLQGQAPGCPSQPHDSLSQVESLDDDT